MNCCQLNSHLFINGISPCKFCKCGEEENTFHFFFECRYYINFRDVLINETLPFTTLSIVKILHGDQSLCTHDIIKLHEAVSKFTMSFKRMTIFQALYKSHFNHRILILLYLLIQYITHVHFYKIM